MNNNYTHLTHIEQNLRYLTTISENSNEGVAITNLNGILNFVNASFAGMHGYQSQESLIDESIAKCHTPKQMLKDNRTIVGAKTFWTKKAELDIDERRR